LLHWRQELGLGKQQEACKVQGGQGVTAAAAAGDPVVKCIALATPLPQALLLLICLLELVVQAAAAGLAQAAAVRRAQVLLLAWQVASASVVLAVTHQLTAAHSATCSRRWLVSFHPLLLLPAQPPPRAIQALQA
jgi:hypothetical protein